MKKILFLTLVAGTLIVSSCTNKNNNEATPDQNNTEQVAEQEATTLTDQLSAAIEASDSTQLQKALLAVNDKVTSLDKEQATLVLNKVQQFLRTKDTQIKNIITTTSPITTLYNNISQMTAETIETVSKLPADAEKAAQQAAEGTVNDVKNAAQQQVNEAAKQVNDAKKAVNQKVQETQKAVDKKVQEVREAPQKAADQAKKKTGEAIDAAASAAKKGLGL